ncbi:MAG: hypothetical protein HDS44_01870 [Bacteroides sp.]|nr:hypothetical protein [Bacteroides sp.]
MKRIILNLLAVMSLAFAVAGNNVEVKIPDKCFDILLPDTASYVVFLTDQKTSSKDNQMRLKVASLRDGQGLWSKKYYPNRYVEVCDQGVIIGDAFNLTLYDFQTGKEIRKLSSRPVYIDHGRNLIIGAKTDPIKGGYNKLVCNALSTGEKLWESKVPRNNGAEWRIVDILDDNTLIVQSDYVGKIDLTTGDLKSHPLKQSVFDKKAFWSSQEVANAVINGAIGGGIAGLLGALGPNTSVSYDIGYFCSDVLKHNGHYFVSDRERLVCLDSDMNEVWQSMFPKDSGSHANLYVHGDTIEMINTGYVEANDRRYKSGRPFRAAFLAGTGESLYIYQFPEKWNETLFGKYLSFVTVPAFIYDEVIDSFSPLKFPLEGAYVITPERNVLHVDSDLNVLDSIDGDKVYYLVAELPDGQILKTNSSTPSFLRIGPDSKIMEKYDSDVRSIMVKGYHLFLQKGDILLVYAISD